MIINKIEYIETPNIIFIPNIKVPFYVAYIVHENLSYIRVYNDNKFLWKLNIGENEYISELSSSDYLENIYIKYIRIEKLNIILKNKIIKR